MHASPGKGAPPQQPSAGVMRISPDRSRCFVELQGKHYIVTRSAVGPRDGQRQPRGADLECSGQEDVGFTAAII